MDWLKGIVDYVQEHPQIWKGAILFILLMVWAFFVGPWLLKNQGRENKKNG